MHCSEELQHSIKLLSAGGHRQCSSLRGLNGTKELYNAVRWPRGKENYIDERNIITRNSGKN
jgi:hypothetical protein